MDSESEEDGIARLLEPLESNPAIECPLSAIRLQFSFNKPGKLHQFTSIFTL